MGNKKTNGNFPSSLFDLVKYKAPFQSRSLKAHLDVSATRLLEIMSQPEKMNINELKKLCKITQLLPSDLYIHYKVGKDVISMDQMNALVEKIEG